MAEKRLEIKPRPLVWAHFVAEDDDDDVNHYNKLKFPPGLRDFLPKSNVFRLDEQDNWIIEKKPGVNTWYYTPIKNKLVGVGYDHDKRERTFYIERVKYESDPFEGVAFNEEPLIGPDGTTLGVQMDPVPIGIFYGKLKVTVKGYLTAKQINELKAKDIRAQLAERLKFKMKTGRVLSPEPVKVTDLTMAKIKSLIVIRIYVHLNLSMPSIYQRTDY